jgi:hypothetical protein
MLSGWDEVTRHSDEWAEIIMTEHRPPAVVRERTSRLTGSRIAIALVFDRDLTPEERASFSRVPAGGTPAPSEFEIDGRMVRYECEAEEAERWRLAFEIYLVKAFRSLAPAPPAHRPSKGIREGAGFRKLYLG